MLPGVLWVIRLHARASVCQPMLVCAPVCLRFVRRCHPAACRIKRAANQGANGCVLSFGCVLVRAQQPNSGCVWVICIISRLSDPIASQGDRCRLFVPFFVSSFAEHRAIVMLHETIRKFFGTKNRNCAIAVKLAIAGSSRCLSRCVCAVGP